VLLGHHVALDGLNGTISISGTGFERAAATIGRACDIPAEAIGLGLVSNIAAFLSSL
jgi:hypothetical protein